MATPSAGDAGRELPAVGGDADPLGARAHRSHPLYRYPGRVLPLATRGLSRCWPALLLLGLTLLFFWKIAFTGQVPVGYDTFAYFYPYLASASTSLRAFRLPLWNPDVFMGAPLAANLQTALFYPATLLYLLLPTPSALSLDIILHTFMAAGFTYLLARRSLDTSPVAALTSAAVFGFGGFFAAQAGHVNQLRAAVWLPLLVLLFDTALRRRSVTFTLASGAVIALTLLAGHSQEAYMVFCALGGYFVWSSAGATRRALNLGEPPGRTLGQSVRLTARMLLNAAAANARGILVLSVAVLSGLALAAVQLLPSLELAQLSVRAGGMGYRQAVSFSLSPLILPQALLPGYWQNPFSEYVGYVGIVGLLLAVLGMAASRGSPRLGFFTALAAAGLVLALGGYTPVYIFGYALVPGFGLFRVPARWLFLYTFGMAMLAGIGMQQLERRLRRDSSQGTSGSSVRRLAASTNQGHPQFARLAGVGPLPPLLMGVMTLWSAHALLLPPALVWFILGICAAWLVLVAGQARTTAASRACLWTLLALLIVELFAASREMEYNHPAPPESVSALRPALAHLLTDDSAYRILSMSLGLFDPGDLADMRLMLPGTTATDFATAAKNKEILAPNTPMLFGIESMDGYDGGILPLQRYVELQQMFLNPWQASVDGRLREHLAEIPEARLLSLLNVKYVVTDKVKDVWIDNIYYDLGNSVTISPTTKAWSLQDLAPFPTGAIGIVSFLVDAGAITDGTPVAFVTIRDATGAEDTYSVRAGRDTAETIYFAAGGPPQHQQARTVSAWRDNPTGSVYLGVLTLKRTSLPRSIEVTYTAATGALVLRGLTQVDPRTGAAQALAISSTGSFRLVHSGDVKLYENTQVLPRAFVVHQAEVFQTNRAVLDALKDPGFQPRTAAVLVADGMDVTPLRSLAAGQPDDVSFRAREPERVELTARLGGNGLLVLTDMWYPGWRAFVDGKETPVYRAYHAFRGVYVPVGEHSIEFVYDGGLWRWGGLISLLAAGAVGIALRRAGRRSNSKGAAILPRPGSGPHRESGRLPDL